MNLSITQRSEDFLRASGDVPTWIELSTLHHMINLMRWPEAGPPSVEALKEQLRRS